MGSFGQLVVCVASVLSAAGGCLALIGASRPAALAASRKMFHAAAAAATAALLILLFLLLAHDYRIAYVREYADRTMSAGYLLMAVWGGQQGSLLLWAVLQAWFTSAAAGLAVKRDRALAPIALAFLATLQLFFFLLVLYHSNPFEALGTIAKSGIGMNPLLRNPYMAVHPPTLYLGFVGFSVPMAFGLAALVEGRLRGGWLKNQRGWILFAWIFLSVGNILGMVWAYEELGWGGYWGWDPVENASFMPWLTGTALLHSVMIVDRRKMFRLFSLILIALTFILVIFGTFLTRSGVIESVHAFAGATTGPYLLGLIVCTTVTFVGLLLWRRKELSGTKPIESPLSPEGIFFIANWAFILAAAFVWFATMAPLFAEVFKGEKIAVTPEFFNQWMVPLGIIILALIGLCSIVGWRSGSSEKIGRRAVWPTIVGIIAAILAALAGGADNTGSGVRAAFPIIAVGSIALVATGLMREIALIVARAARRPTPGGARRRRLGGQLVHLSVALLFVGFTGSAFTEEKSANLFPGKTMRVGEYSLQFLGLREDNNYERHALLADLEVRKSNEPLGVLSPARHNYHSHPGRPTSEVVIRTGLTEDLFLILGEGDPSRGFAIIRAVVNPMIVWIWIGGILLVVGTLIALIPAGWFRAAQSGSTHRLWKTLGVVLFVSAIGVSVGSLRDLATAVVVLAGLGLAGALILFGDALSQLGSYKEGL